MDFPHQAAFLHAPPSSSSSTSRPLRSRAASQSDTSWGINGASKLSISTGPSRGTDTSPGGSSEDRTPSPTPAPSASSKTLGAAVHKPAQKASNANQLLLQVPPFRRPNVGEERRRSSTSHIPIRQPQAGVTGRSGPSGWSAGTALPVQSSTRPRSPPWRHSGQPLPKVVGDGVEPDDKRLGNGTTRARAGSGGGSGASILSGWTGGGLGEGNVYGFVGASNAGPSAISPQAHLPPSSSSPSLSRWWNSRSTGGPTGQNPSSSSQPGHRRHTTNPGSMPSSPSAYLASGSGNYFDSSTRGQGESPSPQTQVSTRRTPPRERRPDGRAERVSRITEGFEPDGSPTSPQATSTTDKPGGRVVDHGKKKRSAGWDVFEEIKREKSRAVSRPPLESFIPGLTQSIQSHLLTLTTRHRSITHTLGEYNGLSQRFDSLDEEGVRLLLSLGVGLDDVEDKIRLERGDGGGGGGGGLGGDGPDAPTTTTTMNAIQDLDVLTSTIESTTRSLDELTKTLEEKSGAMDEVEEKMGRVVPLILAELDRRLIDRQDEIERIRADRLRREWIILVLTILGSIVMVCLGVVGMWWHRHRESGGLVGF